MTEDEQLVERLQENLRLLRADRDDHKAEIERLQAELADTVKTDRWLDDLAAARAREKTLETELAEARAENEQLRQVLSFYAARENYAHCEIDESVKIISTTCGPIDLQAPAGKALGPVLVDLGNRAREALTAPAQSPQPSAPSEAERRREEK